MIEFRLHEQIKVDGHIIDISAHNQQGAVPIARATITGLGDTHNRTVYFDKKGLQKAMNAMDKAEERRLVLQQQADAIYKQLKEI